MVAHPRARIDQAGHAQAKHFRATEPDALEVLFERGRWRNRRDERHCAGSQEDARGDRDFSISPVDAQRARSAIDLVLAGEVRRVREPPIGPRLRFLVAYPHEAEDLCVHGDSPVRPIQSYRMAPSDPIEIPARHHGRVLVLIPSVTEQPRSFGQS